MPETDRGRIGDEHQRAASSAYERDEILRLLEEHIEELVEIRDLQGRSVYASPSVGRFHGDAAAAMRFDLAHPDDVEPARDWWRRILEGATERFEWRSRDSKEEWRWLESTAVPVSYRGRPHVLMISIDVTERNRAEASRKANEERLRLAFDAAKIGTGEMDLHTHTINLSEPMQRVVGLPPGTSLLGFEDWVGRVIHPEDRASVQQAVEKGIAGDPHITLDYRVVWPDGSVHWATSRATVLFDSEGKATRIIGAIMDITDRKHLEDELRQAQKMEAVGHLAGGVAHDFNNLLTIISGSSEMLAHRLGSDDPLQQRVDEIRQAANRAADLTQQLLAFSRRTVLAPRLLDLNEAVGESETLLRRLLGEDVRLKTFVSPGLHPVKVDPVQLSQVIMNLAVNARDAMPTGGTLTIETRNCDLTDAASRVPIEAAPGRYVVLRITDTGRGMTDDVRARLFEPFFTTKEKGQGTGLGLAMVYGIVKQSDGFITVDSQPGHGTVFEIYFPAAEGSLPVGKPVPAQSTAATGTETILLVEDEDAVRGVVSTVLEHAGYTVLEANGGRAAIDLVGSYDGPIHLLITDVVMPEMGGRQLVEHLATVRPDVKVLYLSGHTDDALIRHGILEADVAFLQKPFKIKALTTKVREVLGAA
jgi:two-component system, cell cycle sensor histidine kinase and response regulator CckA